jgi:hypothetical protein
MAKQHLQTGRAMRFGSDGGHNLELQGPWLSMADTGDYSQLNSSIAARINAERAKQSKVGGHTREHNVLLDRAPRSATGGATR